MGHRRNREVVVIVIIVIVLLLLGFPFWPYPGNQG